MYKKLLFIAIGLLVVHGMGAMSGLQRQGYLKSFAELEKAKEYSVDTVKKMDAIINIYGDKLGKNQAETLDLVRKRDAWLAKNPAPVSVPAAASAAGAPATRGPAAGRAAEVKRSAPVPVATGKPGTPATGAAGPAVGRAAPTAAAAATGRPAAGPGAAGARRGPGAGARPAGSAASRATNEQQYRTQIDFLYDLAEDMVKNAEDAQKKLHSREADRHGIESLLRDVNSSLATINDQIASIKNLGFGNPEENIKYLKSRLERTKELMQTYLKFLDDAKAISASAGAGDASAVQAAAAKAKQDEDAMARQRDAEVARAKAEIDAAARAAAVARPVDLSVEARERLDAGFEAARERVRELERRKAREAKAREELQAKAEAEQGLKDIRDYIRAQDGALKKILDNVPGAEVALKTLSAQVIGRRDRFNALKTELEVRGAITSYDDLGKVYQAVLLELQNLAHAASERALEIGKRAAEVAIATKALNDFKAEFTALRADQSSDRERFEDIKNRFLGWEARYRSFIESDASLNALRSEVSKAGKNKQEEIKVAVASSVAQPAPAAAVAAPAAVPAVAGARASAAAAPSVAPAAGAAGLSIAALLVAGREVEKQIDAIIKFAALPSSGSEVRSNAINTMREALDGWESKQVQQSSFALHPAVNVLYNRIAKKIGAFEQSLAAPVSAAAGASPVAVPVPTPSAASAAEKLEDEKRSGPRLASAGPVPLRTAANLIDRYDANLKLLNEARYTTSALAESALTQIKNLKILFLAEKGVVNVASTEAENKKMDAIVRNFDELLRMVAVRRDELLEQEKSAVSAASAAASAAAQSAPTVGVAVPAVVPVAATEGEGADFFAEVEEPGSASAAGLAAMPGSAAALSGAPAVAVPVPAPSAASAAGPSAVAAPAPSAASVARVAELIEHGHKLEKEIAALEVVLEKTSDLNDARKLIKEFLNKIDSYHDQIQEAHEANMDTGVANDVQSVLKRRIDDIIIPKIAIKAADTLVEQARKIEKNGNIEQIKQVIGELDTLIKSISRILLTDLSKTVADDLGLAEANLKLAQQDLSKKLVDLTKAAVSATGAAAAAGDAFEDVEAHVPKTSAELAAAGPAAPAAPASAVAGGSVGVSPAGASPAGSAALSAATSPVATAPVAVGEFVSAANQLKDWVVAEGKRLAKKWEVADNVDLGELDNAIKNIDTRRAGIDSIKQALAKASMLVPESILNAEVDILQVKNHLDGLRKKYLSPSAVSVGSASSAASAAAAAPAAEDAFEGVEAHVPETSAELAAAGPAAPAAPASAVAGGSVGAGLAGAVAVVPAAGLEVKAGAEKINIEQFIQRANAARDWVLAEERRIEDKGNNVEDAELKAFMQQIEKHLAEIADMKKKLASSSIAVPKEIVGAEAGIIRIKSPLDDAFRESEQAGESPVASATVTPAAVAVLAPSAASAVAGGSVGAGPAGAVAVVPAGGSEVKAAAAPVSSVTAPAFPVATQGQRVKDLIAMAKEKKELVERAAEKVADIQNVSIKDLERFLDETEQVLKDLDAAEEEIGNLALAVPDEISTLDAHIRVYREQAKKALKEKEAAEKKARGVAPAFTD